MAVTMTSVLPNPGEREIRNILDRLEGIIGSSGSVRSAQEIPKLVSLMKEDNSLVNRCVLLNTLLATKAQSTLSKFMEGGGWNVLNVWLLDAKKSQNSPLMIEILQVLQKLPVGIVALKQGNLGKIVKQLSKHEVPEVKNLASDILAKWMAVFREGQAARGKATPTGDKLEGGPVSDLQADEPSRAKRDKEREEKKAAKKLKKDLQNAESQPPLGPLVALGKPKEKPSKRPRALSLSKSTPVPEKKAKVSPPVSDEIESEKERSMKNDKGLIESNIFINALSNQAARWQEKRVKKINKSGARTSPTVTKAPTDIETATANMSTSPVKDITNSHPLTNGVTVDQTVDEPMDQEPTADTATPKVPKKRVSWAEESSLVSIHYFEMDESERRVNVNDAKSFLDAAQREKLMEKEALSSRMYDQLMEVIQWYRPLLMDGCVEMIERGKDSVEKEEQAKREQTVLAQLFLSKSSVLPTPTEPDPETEQVDIKIKTIPLTEPGTVAPAGAVYQSPVPLSPVQGGQFKQEPSPPYYIGSPLHGGPGNIHGPPNNMMGGRSEQPVASGQSFPSNYGYTAPPPDYQYYPEGNGSVPYQGGRDLSRGKSRGRGRYSRGVPPTMGNICKHYITHGCRLGNMCKFLHITPDELAVKMSKENNEHSPNSDVHRQRTAETKIA